MVGVFTLFLLPVVASLLIHGVTWKGRLLAAGVCLGLVGVILLLGWRAPRDTVRRRRRIGTGLVALALLLLLPLPLLAPTGKGGEGGAEAAMAAAGDACRRFSLDPGRMALAGLSNGGRGVTRVVAANPGRFRKVALLSAVLEAEPIAKGTRVGAWDGVDVLVLHGVADDRVPLRPVAAMADKIETAGARVTRLILPGEDHFVLLSQEDKAMGALAALLADGVGSR